MRPGGRAAVVDIDLQIYCNHILKRLLRAAGIIFYSEDQVMDNFFEISKRNSTVRAEIIGGLTTFFAMAYIVFVNPNQVAAGGASGWLVGEGAVAQRLLLAPPPARELAQADAEGQQVALVGQRVVPREHEEHRVLDQQPPFP